MRHHDDKLLFCHLAQNVHNLHAGLRVKCTGRLVGKQNIGVVYQRTRDGNTLHLTARHLCGTLLQLIRKSHLTQRLDRALAPLLLGDTREGERQLDVCQHRLVRNEVVALEHEADRVIAVGIPIGVLVELGGNAVDDQITAGVLVETADDIEQGRFTAARRTENRHELISSKVDGYAVEGANAGVTRIIILDDLFQLEH